MPTVWIVNRAGHPYEDAARFGSVEHMSEGNVDGLRPDRLAYNFSKIIAQLVREDDYLLPSGKILPNMIAFGLWLMKFPTVQMLLWNAGRNEYEPRRMTRDQLSSLISRWMDG